MSLIQTKRREETVPIRSRFKLLLAEREMREGRKISYEEISRQTGVSPGSLSGLATNSTQRFDGWVLSALCKYFSCNIGDLLTYMPDGNGDGEIKEAS